MKRISYIILFLIYLIVLYGTYNFIEDNKEKQITAEFNSNLNNLKNHYEIYQYQQKVASKKIYNEISNDKEVIKLIEQLNSRSLNKKNAVRLEIYQLLEDRYLNFQSEGVIELQFISPSSISLLRMENSTFNGDDLSSFRADIVRVNETKEPFSGFHQCNRLHGFRYAYPLFNSEEEYLGVLDITYSTNDLQYNLTNISNIHTHILVDKHIFRKDYYTSSDFSLRYVTSAEHKNLVLSITPVHSKQKCVIENHSKLTKVLPLISENISKGKEFSLYNKHSSYDDKIKLISFYPIKNSISGETISWLVSYRYSQVISDALNYSLIIKIISFVVLTLIASFIYYLINQKNILNQKIQEEAKKIVQRDKLLQEKSKMAAMGEMIDIIGHQWKQPLSIVNMNAQELELRLFDSNINNEYIKNNIEITKKQVSHLNNTIDEFRDFFRPSHNIEAINLGHLIDSLRNLLKNDLQRNSIEIKNLCEEDMFIHANKNDIKHLLINLINNSRDAMINSEIALSKKEITISCHIQNSNMKIQIQDSGTGISNELLEKIFDLNFTTKEKDGGTGVGLYICKQIIKKYNGSIHVVNNRGALFTIIFPL